MGKCGFQKNAISERVIRAKTQHENSAQKKYFTTFKVCEIPWADEINN
jgi:hypothetical protein